MEWPTTQDGTVDWDRVFTAPGTGFIPMVQQANTLPQLKSCVHVIISSLFTRQDDLKYARAYIATLDEVFDKLVLDHAAGEPVMVARSKTIGLLTSIQQNRKIRAQRYLEMKARGEERRLEAEDPLALLEILTTDGA